MKLKKLLAAVTAAALAVTTMAVTSFTASAASEKVLFTGTQHMLNYNDNADESQFDGNMLIDGSELDDYENLSITFSFTADDLSDLNNNNQWKAEEFLEIIIKANDSYSTPWDWISTVKANEKDNAYAGKFDTVDTDYVTKVATSDIKEALSKTSGFDYLTMSNAIIFKTGWIKGVTVKKVAFTDPTDTTVYTVKTYSPERTNEADIFFDGTWDLTKAVGSNARVEFTFKNDDASGGFAVCDASVEEYWTKQLLQGSASKTSFKVSEIQAAGFGSPLKIMVNGWNGSVPTGMKIYNGSGDELYTPATQGGDLEQVTAVVDPHTATVKPRETVQLTCIVTGKDDAVVTWESNDEAIATVDNTGLVTGVSEGGVEIWPLIDGERIESSTSFAVVTVSEEGGNEEPTPPVDKGDKFKETKTVEVPSEGDRNFVTIIASEKNLVPTDIIELTVISGSVTKVGLNAFNMDWGGWQGAWSEEGVMTITATVQDLMDAIGATTSTFQGFLAQYIGGAAGDSITYTLTITSASQSGEEPTPPDLGDVNEFSYVIAVNDVNLTVGETVQGSASGSYYDPETGVNKSLNPGTFKWSVEDTSIATVSESGLFTAVAPGTTRGKVRYEDVNFPNGYIEKSFNVTVKASTDTPSEPSVPSVPSAPTVPSTSSNSSPVTSTTVVDTILATPDGGSGSVSLGSNTKLDKVAMEALATKGNVTVKFTVSGGAYWEINGENVTKAKAVDLGVKVNGTLIPKSKVEEFAGDKTTVQLTLKHNGDFGFTGVLNVPINKANNGKFANLYYYHGGQFDFVGSSAIVDGRAKFAFSHASNYLIVIDDYAYGEDVSSAAGMTETTETSAVPYVALTVAIAAFGTSAIVLKKRLSK